MSSLQVQVAFHDFHRLWTRGKYRVSGPILAAKGQDTQAYCAMDRFAQVFDPCIGLRSSSFEGCVQLINSFDNPSIYDGVPLLRTFMLEKDDHPSQNYDFSDETLTHPLVFPPSHGSNGGRKRRSSGRTPHTVFSASPSSTGRWELCRDVDSFNQSMDDFYRCAT